MYGNYPCKFYGKTERTPAGTAAVQEKAADLERQAVEAIGKNFVKASAESVNEALEKMGTASKEKNAQAASGGQPAGLQRLNSLLLELMGKEGAVRYPALLSFLSRYGEKGAAEILPFLLLKQSGQNVVLLHKEQQGGSFMRADMGGKQDKAAQRMEKTFPEGILYGKRDGREIHVEKGYREQIRKNERFSIPLYSEADVRQLKGKNYSGADIERTQRFLDYFTNRGDLYQRLPAIRGNEELAGFLLAENMVKAQVYSEYAGVGKSMGKDIRQAFQRLINFYLEPGSDRHGAQASALRETADMGKVRRIYYHIMRILWRSGNREKYWRRG